MSARCRTVLPSCPGRKIRCSRGWAHKGRLWRTQPQPRARAVSSRAHARRLKQRPDIGAPVAADLADEQRPGGQANFITPAAKLDRLYPRQDVPTQLSLDYQPEGRYRRGRSHYSRSLFQRTSKSLSRRRCHDRGHLRNRASHRASRRNTPATSASPRFRCTTAPSAERSTTDAGRSNWRRKLRSGASGTRKGNNGVNCAGRQRSARLVVRHSRASAPMPGSVLRHVDNGDTAVSRIKISSWLVLQTAVTTGHRGVTDKSG